MAEQKFFTGQTVKLRSSGPVMTVMGTTGGFSLNLNLYVCQWFSGKSYKQAEFPAQNLKLAVPEEAPLRRIARAKPGRMYLGR
jgi:uncharacterized protein YodC (DUF2158 family)